ncbi:hypothetical protein LINPERPRIM_LOCUS15521, partial [Linum perenne]
FSCSVFHKKIATVDNLQRRGFSLANKCVLCCSAHESVNHIFIQCAFASEIWKKLSSTLSIYGPRHSDVRDFISEWKGLNCVSEFTPALKMLMHSTFWLIWKERNNRIFDDSASSASTTLRKITFDVADCLTVHKQFTPDTAAVWRRLNFDNG